MKNLKNLRVYMVSLGCPKNRVDSEKTLAKLARQGCSVVADPAEAECILVNTCGFIGEAREESIDTILGLAEYKKKRPEVKLAVMGCMVELFHNDMADAMPEIDILVGLHDKDTIDVQGDGLLERTMEPGAVSAYLKIAEGCGNSCSFCSIPLIRGPLKSRSVDDVVMEARSLISKGIKEISLISQDTTRFGLDLKMKDGLVTLVREVLEEKPDWIRLHYLYPTFVSDSLIDLVASEPSLCGYFDIPFQHIDSGILKRMGRQETESDIKDLVGKIRHKAPGAAIRSAFIVGFPGEGDEEFGRLYDFVREAKLDHVGIFSYSPETGTPAEKIGDTVPNLLKEERKNILMELQKGISAGINSAKVGKKFPLLVERYREDENLLTGRLMTQAAEIDGEVILDESDTVPGELVEAEITGSMEYDLIGRVVEG
jgi:ribosomal protein S12 methylthiotransferase